MSAQKWQYETKRDGRVARARGTRSAIVVRVEREGDTVAHAEYSYARLFGLETAAALALAEARDEDIRP